MRKFMKICVALTIMYPSASLAEMTLKFIHYQSGNQPELREILNEFEALNPGIKVQDLPTQGAGQVVSEIQAAAAAKRPFDVGQVLARTVLGVIDIANGQEFSKSPDGGAFMNNISPKLVNVANVDGELYMMPHSFGTPMLYINLDMVEKAGYSKDWRPKNHEDALAVAKKIAESTNLPGICYATGGIDFMHQTMVRAKGSPYLKNDRAVFDDEAGIQMFQLWADLADEGTHPKIPGKDCGAAFNAGRLGMIINSSAALRGNTKAAEGRYELGVTKFPLFENVSNGELPNSGSGLMVLAQEPERIEASFKLLMFLSQPEVTNRWSRNTGYMPVAVDPMADEKTEQYIESNPDYAAVIEQMKQTSPTILWPGNRIVEAQTVVANLLEDLWAGKGTAAELAPIAADEVDRILIESTK